MKYKSLLLALPLALLLNACSQEERAAVAEQANETLKLDHKDVFTLKVGSCFNNTTELTSSNDGVATLPIRECSELHDNEVFFIHTFPDAPNVPTDAELDTAADTYCRPEFEKFIGKDFDSSEIEMSTLLPSAESWATGDRELLCYVAEPNGKQTQGSLKGANR